MGAVTLAEAESHQKQEAAYYGNWMDGQILGNHCAGMDVAAVDRGCAGNTAECSRIAGLCQPAYKDLSGAIHPWDLPVCTGTQQQWPELFDSYNLVGPNPGNLAAYNFDGGTTCSDSDGNSYGAGAGTGSAAGEWVPSDHSAILTVFMEQVPAGYQWEASGPQLAPNGGD